ncbi:MAG TPA: dihydrodipicolinate reductase C-terminal domain-containing protein [Candidatus Baltobacteraceae bacterium]|nr:dihydrodipicolinate reductase C-terminal domain-containing protein [Candidatus Baltobacteraceae bacterium]
MLRVAVAGALGRMGRVACTALREATDVTYAGGLARTRVPDEAIVTDFDELMRNGKPDVLLDLTTYPDTVQISMNALAHGVRPVIGATGWGMQERDALEAMARERDLGAMLVPNFSIAAALMMKFAGEAARFFPSVEIIEMHHDKKKDAPSGTAKITAERIAKEGGPANVPIHSVRMRGLVAHHEVLFGIDGELLTIRHDTLSRESFAPGMLAAVRAVMSVRGLQVGLDA